MENTGRFWKTGIFCDFLLEVISIMAILLPLEGIVLSFVSNPGWRSLVLLLFSIVQLGWMAVYLPDIYRRPEERKALHSPVDKWIVISAILNAFLSIAVCDMVHFGKKAWPLIPLAILFQAYALYHNDRKVAEVLEIEEAENGEPAELLHRVSQSDHPVFIVVSHGSQQDLESELLDASTVLYTLPDGRYLILFQKRLRVETFQMILSSLRTKVNADEDVVGYYGRPHKRNHLDESLAFVSDLSGECRVIPFDPNSVPMAGAKPLIW